MKDEPSRRDELLALAERCEALAGADWIVDAQIDLLVRPHAGEEDAPPYTGSIDIATSLVPEGWQWSVEQHPEKPAKAWAYKGTSPLYFAIEAATPALALTAAALRALAAEQEPAP